MTLVSGKSAILTARNDFLFSVNDTLRDEFQLALNGLGGRGCDPTTGTPGEGNCEYYNPFATLYGPLPNSDEVINSFTAKQTIDSTTDLQVIEAFASTELFEMEGGAAGLAFGFTKWREQKLDQDYDSLSNQDSFSLSSVTLIPRAPWTFGQPLRKLR